MPALKQTSVTSFKEYVSHIESLRQGTKGRLWYRGAGRTTYKLEPTLFRHKQSKTIEDYLNLEDELLARFRQRSIPFQDRTISDLWDLLFLMQHFGIPTRLLDWSESPLMALFFAVTSAPHRLSNRGKPVFEADAAVWVLDPIKWNKRAVNLKSFEGKILTTDDANAGSYNPVGDCSIMKDFPIAIYGAHNSQRIVAQRGVFVCFGKDTRPMDEMYTSETFLPDSLTKVTIAKGKLPHFYDALQDHGITDSVVFPDLDGLAREIKREFNFEA